MDDRYELGPVLGRGGMGEVRLAYDARFDRDVAIKRMLPGQDARAFEAEARLQAGLDHPAVVPVHDLELDGDRPYIVMKRLTGVTLLDALAWPRRTLLARFVDVCLAIERVHSRGVVHRDLKPANIMLGDFGEAYVLDWGLAGPPGDTTAIIGTRGYMAPEQIGGRATTASDVYALGCILYEIATGEPALPPDDAIAVALTAPCLRPRDRAARGGASDPLADVPPELDDACAAATAADASQRPTARGLADLVQAYLDGTRDTERRRELAAHHLERAASARDRATAIREAGRALALDPDSATAQQMLAGLLIDIPPGEMPARARVEVDLARARARQLRMRWLAVALVVFSCLMATLFLGRVRAVAPIAAISASNTLTAVICALASRRPMPRDAPLYRLALWSQAATLAGGCMVLGPLFVMPVMTVTAIAGALDERTTSRARSVLVPYLLGVAIPLALERVGVLPASFSVTSDGLALTPPGLELEPWSAIFLELLSILSGMALIAAFAIKTRRLGESAQDRVHAQAWLLRQLAAP